jgi:cytochrome c
MVQKKGILAIVVLALIVVGYFTLSSPEPEITTQHEELGPTSIVDVKIPETLSARASLGKKIYEVKCVVCHGQNGEGTTGVAPPLVHLIYEPSHHGDMAFVIAAQRGVQSHHWPFGNMPKVEGITKAEVLDVVVYIRELQRENGIL